MYETTALLISSDSALRRSVEEAVASVSHLHLRTVSTLMEAEEHIQEAGVSLLLVHLAWNSDAAQIPFLLRQCALGQRAVATLVISERYNATEALSLLGLGVAEYLDRPLDLRRLAYLLDVLTVRVRHALRAPVSEAAGSLVADFIWRQSEAMEGLMDQVRRVAPQDVSIILAGETGTGKSRLARLIHDLSPRRDLPFRISDCASLSTHLSESEMFGHVKGAFTGADRDRIGKFAEVGSGTLFLDDVDALSLELQAKLLRVVEDRIFEPVGSNQVKAMKARLIVASNRNLEQEVAAGRFRSDLYYRLNVVGFSLPPLRERVAALPAIAARFIDEYAAKNHRPVEGMSFEALHALQTYSWPGNIRELRNVIERAVALCRGDQIELEDLPACILKGATTTAHPETIHPEVVGAPLGLSPPKGPVSLWETREVFELARIREALARNKNNRVKAAAELGISRMTLYNKLRQHGLTDAVI